MPSFSPEAIGRFEEVLQKDPNSQVFAPLAEAYRLEARLTEAYKIAMDGVRRHPSFASGWLASGKVLRDLKRLEEAREALGKAVQLAPENLLALQLLAETELELKHAKEALKLFKRLLFLNPLSEKARRVVGKLESLTADEYSDEMFSMTRLGALDQGSHDSQKSEETLAPVVPPTTPEKKAAEASKGLWRMLSLIDAFIVRNEIGRASQLLDETRLEFGEQAEISQRQVLLQRRRSSQLASREERAQPLAPLASREEQIRQRKVNVLKALLRRIDDHSSALR